MPTPIEVVTIDKDIFISTLSTIGAAFIVLGGLILKLVERNIINHINACHDGLASDVEHVKEVAYYSRKKITEHLENHP